MSGSTGRKGNPFAAAAATAAYSASPSKGKGRSRVVEDDEEEFDDGNDKEVLAALEDQVGPAHSPLAR